MLNKRQVGLLIVAGLLVASAGAAQIPLYHQAVIDLGPYFNDTTGYGDNPLSVAFDGVNAYVGGYKATTASPGTVGVVRIDSVLGPLPGFTPLSNTLFTCPQLRGLDALAYEPGTGALLMSHDSGTAGTSFISRRDPADGSVVWTVNGPQNARPFAMAIDPVGDNGSPGVAFLTQGSGRRRLLSLATGATIFDGTNGGIINTSPDSGTTWRAIAFDDVGNVVVANQRAYGYGVRNTYNQWMTLGGTLNLTTRSVLKSVEVNNVGQGIVILEDLGSDLLAFSCRRTDPNNFTMRLTDALGGFTDVDTRRVLIRNLDGTTTGLTQLELVGDEDGIGTPWTSDIKNLAFGHDSLGRPVLLVVDFVGRRLDVYLVPEPAAVILALSGLLMLRRR
jgi:hypothetical protein